MADTGVLTVIERIPLRSEYATPEGALLAGRAYGNLTGPNAHRQPGYAAQASFFFEPRRRVLTVIYPWYGENAVQGLLNSERTIMDQWLAAYAAGPREVSILSEIAIEMGNPDAGQPPASKGMRECLHPEKGERT
jgi:hypothetical protein